eukprot:c5632_g1_i1.p1 GENE.c5632_g1_i1~~c5632_g1_i1.p1  ORF type:complete len:491 (-),score=145.53 c5632_g1_i1:251-1723(-)
MKGNKTCVLVLVALALSIASAHSVLHFQNSTTTTVSVLSATANTQLEPQAIAPCTDIGLVDATVTFDLLVPGTSALWKSAYSKRIIEYMSTLAGNVCKETHTFLDESQYTQLTAFHGLPSNKTCTHATSITVDTNEIANDTNHFLVHVTVPVAAPSVNGAVNIVSTRIADALLSGVVNGFVDNQFNVEIATNATVNVLSGVDKLRAIDSSFRAFKIAILDQVRSLEFGDHTMSVNLGQLQQTLENVLLTHANTVNELAFQIQKVQTELSVVKKKIIGNEIEASTVVRDALSVEKEVNATVAKFREDLARTMEEWESTIQLSHQVAEVYSASSNAGLPENTKLFNEITQRTGVPLVWGSIDEVKKVLDDLIDHVDQQRINQQTTIENILSAFADFNSTVASQLSVHKQISDDLGRLFEVKTAHVAALQEQVQTEQSVIDSLNAQIQSVQATKTESKQYFVSRYHAALTADQAMNHVLLMIKLLQTKMEVDQ